MRGTGHELASAAHAIPKVSVYIPCYNVANYLAPVLEGALQQTLPPDEILVIDDGSKDQTCEIAARYPVTIVRHERNRGLAAARNTGIPGPAMAGNSSRSARRRERGDGRRPAS
jgi:GT2 family glycosyltransferase